MHETGKWSIDLSPYDVECEFDKVCGLDDEWIGRAMFGYSQDCENRANAKVRTGWATESVTDDFDAFKLHWTALSINEKIDMLYRAEANGVELPPMLIPIFEAVRDADNQPS
jgi:hypothetical protein